MELNVFEEWRHDPWQNNDNSLGVAIKSFFSNCMDWLDKNPTLLGDPEDIELNKQNFSTYLSQQKSILNDSVSSFIDCLEQDQVYHLACTLSVYQLHFHEQKQLFLNEYTDAADFIEYELRQMSELEYKAQFIKAKTNLPLNNFQLRNNLIFELPGTSFEFMLEYFGVDKFLFRTKAKVKWLRSANTNKPSAKENEKSKAQLEVSLKAQNLKEVFIDEEKYEKAITVLANAEPPIVSTDLRYNLGPRKKGAITAWVKILRQKGYIENCSDANLAKLMNRAFSSLKLSKDGRTLRNYGSTAYNNYKNYLGENL